MTWEEAIINNPSSTSNLRGNKIWFNAREENKIKEGMMKNLHIKSKLKVNIMVMETYLPIDIITPSPILLISESE